MKYVAMIAALTAIFGLCADNIYLRNENERLRTNPCHINSTGSGNVNVPQNDGVITVTQ